MAEFETALAPAEETAFQAWKQTAAPTDTGADYDLRGAYKAGLKPDPATGHWPDTFKKPNHPTFSNQSIYAQDKPERAGRWENGSFVPPGDGGAPALTDGQMEKMFAGLDKMGDALPLEQKQRMDQLLATSPDPDADKAEWATAAYLAHTYRKPVSEIAPILDAYRQNYAKQMGWDQVAGDDNKAFYTRVGQHFDNQQKQSALIDEGRVKLWDQFKAGESNWKIPFTAALADMKGKPGYDPANLDAYRHLAQQQWQQWEAAGQHYPAVVDSVGKYLAAYRTGTATTGEIDGLRQTALKALQVMPEKDVGDVLALATRQMAAAKPAPGAYGQSFMDAAAARGEKGFAEFGTTTERGLRDMVLGAKPPEAWSANPNPNAPNPGEEALLPEWQQRKTERMLDQVAQGKLDPLKGSNMISEGMLSFAQGLPQLTSLMTVPGIAVNLATFAEEARTHFEDAGFDPKSAHAYGTLAAIPLTALMAVAGRISMGEGAGEALVDKAVAGRAAKLAEKAASSEFPGEAAAFQAKASKLAQGLITSDSVKDYLKRRALISGVDAAVLYGVTVGQQLTEPAVQTLAHQMDATIPGVKWSGKDGQWAHLAGATPETLISLAPLIVLGAGAGMLRDVAHARETINNIPGLRAMGVPEDTISQMQQAKNPDVAVRLLQDNWNERKPNPDAVEKLNAKTRSESAGIAGPVAPAEAPTASAAPKYNLRVNAQQAYEAAKQRLAAGDIFGAKNAAGRILDEVGLGNATVESLMADDPGLTKIEAQAHLDDAAATYDEHAKAYNEIMDEVKRREGPKGEVAPGRGPAAPAPAKPPGAGAIVALPAHKVSRNPDGTYTIKDGKGNPVDHASTPEMAAHALLAEKAKLRTIDQANLQQEQGNRLELSRWIKGKLPHPEGYGGVLAGELRDLYDSLTTTKAVAARGVERLNKAGVKVPARAGYTLTSKAAANAFFAKQGKRVDLDRLREKANEAGFQFDTPADLMVALAGSMKGQKVYANPTFESQVREPQAAYGTQRLTQGDKYWLDPQGKFQRVGDHEDFAAQQILQEHNLSWDPAAGVWKSPEGTQWDWSDISREANKRGWIRVVSDSYTGDNRQQLFLTKGTPGEPVKLTREQKAALEDQSFDNWDVVVDTGKGEETLYRSSEGGVKEGQAPYGPAFYSRLTRTIEQSPQGKASGEQWKATIRKSKLGVNKDEYALVGVDDLEDGKTYTKQEVLDYLKANEVKVEDVTLGNPKQTEPVKPFVPPEPLTKLPEGYDLIQDQNAPEDRRWGITPPGQIHARMWEGAHPTKEAAIAAALRKVNLEREWDAKAKWDDNHPQPKAETHFGDYTLPGAEPGSYREVLLTVPGEKSTQTKGGYIYGSGKTVTRDETWSDGHSQYSSIPNPIVRLRHNDRITPDSKRMLFLEEVQAPQKSEFAKMPALFQKNWREIAFKWALRKAVEEGYDSIGWTTGDQQAERYDLSKQVNRIEWMVRVDPEEGSTTKHVIVDTPHGLGRFNLNHDGTVSDAPNAGIFAHRDLVGKHVGDVLGKDVAAKLAESEDGELKGEGLKVGGEGLKKLYDQDFRNVVNNLPVVKKAGQKVGTEQIGTGDTHTFKGTATLQQVEELVARRREHWADPATRTHEGWKNWNVSLDAQASQVIKAMKMGAPFNGAMAAEGSPALAEHLGGKFIDEPVTNPVHSLAITPEMRPSVMAGQNLAERGQAPFGGKEQPQPPVVSHAERLKNFEQWFKGSAVVTPEGKPLVVYHGTKALTEKGFAFDYARIVGRNEGAGFYFTDNKDVASGYGTGGSVIASYLNIKKPMPYEEPAFGPAVLKKLVTKVAELEAERNGEDIEDGFLANYGDARSEGLGSVIESAVDGLTGEQTALDQISGMVGSGVAPEVVNRATEAVTGFDGIVAKGFSNLGAGVHGKKQTIYVAFFPEQIKSVGNRGTFNPADANILHERQNQFAFPFPEADSVQRKAASDYVRKNRTPESLQPEAEASVSRVLAAAQGQLAIPYPVQAPGVGDDRRASAVSALTQPTAQLEGPLALKFKIQHAYEAGDRVSSIIGQLVRDPKKGWDIRGAVVKSPKDLAMLAQVMRSPFVETTKVAFLDNRDRVIHSEILSIGSTTQALLSTDMLQRAALNAGHQGGGRRVIISHNHPSGDPAPSVADNQVTKQFGEFCRSLGWEFVDHVITNGETYFSYKEQGMAPPGTKTGGPLVHGKLAEGEHVAAKTPLGTPAPWETVKRGDLRMIGRTEESQKLFNALKQVDPTALHILYLDRKNKLTAFERLTDWAEDKDQFTRAMRAISAGSVREGATGFMLVLPDGLTAPRESEFVRAVGKFATDTGMSFHDAMAPALGGGRTLESQSLMPPRGYLREPGQGVAEPKQQTDMFEGGDETGSTDFTLQGQQATDFSGIMDAKEASALAKKKAEQDQMGLFGDQGGLLNEAPQAYTRQPGPQNWLDAIRRRTGDVGIFVKQMAREIAILPQFKGFREVLNRWVGDRQLAEMHTLADVHRVMQALPKRMDRIAMANWLAAGGDKNKLQFWAENSEDPRLKVGYEAAMNLTPEQLKIGGWIRDWYNTRFERAEQANIIAKDHFLKDYVTQMVERPVSRALEQASFSGDLAKNFKYSRERTFPDFFELERAGFNVRTKDIAEIMAAYDHELNKAILTRQLAKDLLTVKNDAGEAMGVPINGILQPGEGTEPNFISNPKMRKVDRAQGEIDALREKIKGLHAEFAELDPKAAGVTEPTGKDLVRTELIKRYNTLTKGIERAAMEGKGPRLKGLQAQRAEIRETLENEHPGWRKLHPEDDNGMREVGQAVQPANPKDKAAIQRRFDLADEIRDLQEQIHELEQNKEPDGGVTYESINHPAFQKWWWIGKDPTANKDVFMQGEIGLHPDIRKHVINAVGRSELRKWMAAPASSLLAGLGKDAMRLVDSSNRFLKQSMLGGISTFHAIHEMKRGAASGVIVNPFKLALLAAKGKPVVDADNPRVQYAVRHGLMLAGEREAMNEFTEGLGSFGGITSMIPGLRDLTHFVSGLTFHYLIPSLKLKQFEAHLERNLGIFKDPLVRGRVTKDDIAYLTATQVNARYGHLNYADLGRNPTLQHIFSIAALAPDFWESNMRNYGQALRGIAGSRSGRMPAYAFIITAGAVWLVARILNMTLNDDGDPHFDEPFVVVANGRRYTMRNEVEDLVRFIEGLKQTMTKGGRNQYVSGRMSPMLGSLIDGLTGSNWRGEKITPAEALAEFFAKILPISARWVPGIRWLQEHTATGRARTITPFQEFLTSQGIQVSRYSPLADAYELANKWETDQGHNEDRGTYPVSKYQQLRYALEDADFPRAREEVQKMAGDVKLKPGEVEAAKESGISEQQLRAVRATAGLHQSIFRPWTGSRAQDVKFKESLDDIDRVKVEHAEAWRLELWRRFMALGDPAAP